MTRPTSLLAMATVAIMSTLAARYSAPEADSTAGSEDHGVVPNLIPFMTESAQTEPPDTMAQAVWSYLQTQDYRKNWSLWPGKAELYSGTEPHGMLLTTYANDAAYEALMQGRVASLPAGSIIVKENYMPDSSFAAATVMYKVNGYNPDQQDRLFAKYGPDGGAEAFGRAPMCQSCHQGAKNGYIFTPVSR